VAVQPQRAGIERVRQATIVIRDHDAGGRDGFLAARDGTADQKIQGPYETGHPEE